MITQKLSAAPVNGADVLAVLDRRLGELEQRRLIITEQILAVEKTVGTGRNDNTADVQQAEALLNGEKFSTSRMAPPISQLAALNTERDVIDRALKIGRSQQCRLATERATKIWADHFGQIAEIEKRRVTLALELQRTNRAREDLRSKITAAGGAGYLSTDGAELLGFRDSTDVVEWCVKRLIADGVANRRELEKGSGNG